MSLTMKTIVGDKISVDSILIPMLDDYMRIKFLAVTVEHSEIEAVKDFYDELDVLHSKYEITERERRLRRSILSTSAYLDIQNLTGSPLQIFITDGTLCLSHLLPIRHYLAVQGNHLCSLAPFERVREPIKSNLFFVEDNDHHDIYYVIHKMIRLFGSMNKKTYESVNPSYYRGYVFYCLSEYINQWTNVSTYDLFFRSFTNCVLYGTDKWEQELGIVILTKT